MLICVAFKSESFKPVGSSAEKDLQATMYSLTGSIYEYLYFSSNPAVTDPTCSTTPAQSFGAFVNVCNVDHGFSFKLQLTDSKDINHHSDHFSLLTNKLSLFHRLLQWVHHPVLRRHVLPQLPWFEPGLRCGRPVPCGSCLGSSQCLSHFQLHHPSCPGDDRQCSRFVVSQKLN